MLGHIPTKEEYMEGIKDIDASSADIYRYLNFDKLPEYKDVADGVEVSFS
jgi:aconitate hydratase 2/2-methylisocitrate dehydratase